MDDKEVDARRAMALGFMKRAARDAFRVCAAAAEAEAAKVESGALSVDAPTALRRLASVFIAVSEEE